MTTAASKLLREPWLLVCIVKFLLLLGFSVFHKFDQKFSSKNKIGRASTISLMDDLKRDWFSIGKVKMVIRWVSIRWKEVEPKISIPILFFDWQILQRIQKWTISNVEQWFFPFQTAKQLVLLCTTFTKYFCLELVAFRHV